MGLATMLLFRLRSSPRPELRSVRRGVRRLRGLGRGLLRLLPLADLEQAVPVGDVGDRAVAVERRSRRRPRASPRGSRRTACRAGRRRCAPSGPRTRAARQAPLELAPSVDVLPDRRGVAAVVRRRGAAPARGRASPSTRGSGGSRACDGSVPRARRGRSRRRRRASAPRRAAPPAGAGRRTPDSIAICWSSSIPTSSANALSDSSRSASGSPVSVRVGTGVLLRERGRSGVRSRRPGRSRASRRAASSRAKRSASPPPMGAATASSPPSSTRMAMPSPRSSSAPGRRRPSRRTSVGRAGASRGPGEPDDAVAPRRCRSVPAASSCRRPSSVPAGELPDVAAGRRPRSGTARATCPTGGSGDRGEVQRRGLDAGLPDGRGRQLGVSPGSGNDAAEGRERQGRVARRSRTGGRGGQRSAPSSSTGRPASAKVVLHEFANTCSRRVAPSCDAPALGTRQAADGRARRAGDPLSGHQAGGQQCLGRDDLEGASRRVAALERPVVATAAAGCALARMAPVVGVDDDDGAVPSIPVRAFSTARCTRRRVQRRCTAGRRRRPARTTAEHARRPGHRRVEHPAVTRSPVAVGLERGLEPELADLVADLVRRTEPFELFRASPRRPGRRRAGRTRRRTGCGPVAGPAQRPGDPVAARPRASSARPPAGS